MGKAQSELLKTAFANRHPKGEGTKLKEEETNQTKEKEKKKKHHYQIGEETTVFQRKYRQKFICISF